MADSIELKNRIRDMIKDRMGRNNTPAAFSMAKLEVKRFYSGTDNELVVNDIIKNVSYQSVVNKMADKDAERLLVLNSDGSSTGQHEDRKIIHKQGLWHREVAAIVLREDGTFAIITRSSKKKSYPGAKGLICGHVEGRSTCHEAVVAECSEEVGTLFAQEDFIRLMPPLQNPREDNKAFTSAFIVSSQLKPGVFIYQEQEVDGVEWVTVEKLEQLVKLSKYPEFEDMVIFKDTQFYRGLISSLKKLFTLDNWFDHLTLGDYETIHKHLGLTTPEEERNFYERKKIRTGKSVKKI